MRNQIWEHDCHDCFYLGSHQDPEHKRTCDLYHCENGPGHTVIARYGDGEGEYLSGLAAADFVPILGVAKKIAIDLGLIYETTKRTGAKK